MENILDTKIDYYPGKIWKCTPLGKVTLRQFVSSVKNPKPKIKTVFNKIAEAEQKEDWETKGKLKQENLFYFTFCVNLDGKGRSYSNIKGFTGLMILDFDHLTTNAESFRDKLFESLKSVVICYVSASKKGVKAIIKIPIVNSTDEFKEYFYGIASKLEHMKSFDPAPQNCVLPNFLSWDEGIRWRENPETWTTRGGKYDEFEEFEGEIEEIDNVTSEDKKEVLKRVYNIIKKADEENIGHPNCLSASLLIGGYTSSGYITYDEAKNYMFKWIDESNYLSQKANTYKKTTLTMMNKGMKAPLYLNKHKPKQEQTETKETKKRDKKYYLLCPKQKFEIKKYTQLDINC